MHIRLSDFLARLPLPSTERWPEGVWDIDAFSHGSMSTILFAPRGTDYQTFHAQDELYIVLSGSGVLLVEDERLPFSPGDVLFVEANKPHRFIEFSNDLITWAVFWGPEGGKTASSRTPEELPNSAGQKGQTP
jgi:mannose-6-phosphate isomerase-like protein (cupin superfamily)